MTTSRSSADDTEALREAILLALNEGLTPSQVARRLGCSRTTVYKVKKLIEDTMTDLKDKRRGNKGRPTLYSTAIWAIVLQMRMDNPTMGPAMLHHTLVRNAAAHHINPEDVPSPASIAQLIHRHGLAVKPVGPRDMRVYPDAKPTAPGVVTIDTWGPWHCRAQRLYLITLQDRFTRAATAMPVSSLLRSTSTVATAMAWPKAIHMAHLLMPPGQGLTAVYTDNGVGMVPAFGTLPQGARYALRYGGRCVFIPPGQPWRNGRLERFHYTMEREYFRQSFPPSIAEALTGLHDWLNYYNHDRPHSSLDYKAPGDLFTWLQRATQAPWDFPDPDRIGPQEGLVEALRLVNNRGEVELWQGHVLRLSSIFAGQYVRVQFQVTGEPSIGRVVYSRMKHEEIVIATFNHTLDVAKRGAATPLVTDVVLVDWDAGHVPGNQRLDQDQADNARGRTAKHAVRWTRNDSG